MNLDRPYTSNGFNQYTAAGGNPIVHNANGNLQSDGTWYYTYDAENRLAAVDNGRATALRYDALGRLYEVSDNATGVTRFLHDGNDLVAEYDASGAMLRRYVHGSDRVMDDPLLWYEGSTVSAATRRYLYADERGSIIGWTDSVGNLPAANRYDDYGIPDLTGNLTTEIATKGRFRYTGQVWLPEVGLYYYKARMYSPTLGRFMQTDPIGYGDGMNMYRYAGNDPVNFVDPSGLYCTITNNYRIGGYVSVAGGDPVPQYVSDGVEISGDCGGGGPNVTPVGDGGFPGGGESGPGLEPPEDMPCATLRKTAEAGQGALPGYITGNKNWQNSDTLRGYRNYYQGNVSQWSPLNTPTGQAALLFAGWAFSNSPWGRSTSVAIRIGSVSGRAGASEAGGLSLAILASEQMALNEKRVRALDARIKYLDSGCVKK